MTIHRDFRLTLLSAMVFLCVMLVGGCVKCPECSKKEETGEAGSILLKIVASPDKTNNPNWRVPPGFTVETSEGWDKETGCAIQIMHIKSGIVLRFVPAGEFDMGSRISAEEAEHRYGEEDQGIEWHEQEHPLHKVKISRPFYIGVYEVTQKQWAAIMGNSPSHFKGDNLPVETVSWDDTQEFCRKAGDGLRLPTEAEWEYACRAGTETRWYFGNDESTFGEYAWYRDNAGEKTHETGRKKPNAWRLYDMYGNVWEWCGDRYDRDYYNGWENGVTDPPGPQNEKYWYRVVRGGAWYVTPRYGRSANRVYSDPAGSNKTDGFRVAMPAGIVR